MAGEEGGQGTSKQVRLSRKAEAILDMGTQATKETSSMKRDVELKLGLDGEKASWGG